MSTGTKVFLTIFAVLVGLLVLYYGVLMPAGSADLPVEASGPETVASAVAIDQPSAAATDQATARPAPRTLDPAPLVANRPAAPLVPPPARVLGTDGLGGASPMIPDPVRENPPTSESETIVAATDLATPPPVGSARANVAADLLDVGSPLVAATPLPPVTRPPVETTPPVTLAPATRREPLQYTDHVIEEGDTLSGIAQTWFGDAGKWHFIAQANPTVDPIRLRIGQSLRLPPRDATDARTTAPRPAAGDRDIVYVVQAGDTLSGIARMYYHDTGKWRVIHDSNRRILGSQPDRLEIGMRLVIPPPFPQETASR